MSSLEILDFWTCLFLDPPTENTTVIDGSLENYTFYKCFAYGKYILEEEGDASASTMINGYSVCVFVWIVTVIVGNFGIVTNVLNVIVLRKSHKDSSIKYLLIVLAVMEFVVCVSGMLFSYMIVCILGNLNRSKMAYQWFRVASIMLSLSRTASIYVTILTTIERYIVVAFPYMSKKWLTPAKTGVHCVIVGVLAIVLNISLILNPTVSTVDPEDIFPPNTHAEKFPYIFKDAHFTNREMHEVLVVLNYVAPFPLQLLFNGLLFKSIFDWKQARVRMSGSHKNEINVAKMFSLIVIIVLSCHTMSSIVFFLSRIKKLIYRELIVVQLLCVVVKASTNFIVYYAFGKSFRKELHRLITATNKKFCLCFSKGK